jgi:hypothetical protein
MTNRRVTINTAPANDVNRPHIACGFPAKTLESTFKKA